MESTKTQEYQARTKNAHSLLRLVYFLGNFLLYDLPGGKKIIKVSTVVSTVCLVLIPVTLYLKSYFHVETLQSWWTTALYVSYLFVWPSKGFFFPDESWEPRQTWLSAIVFATYNLAELLSGFYFVSGYHPHEYPLADGQWLALCTVVYVLGVLCFTISDAQKHFILKYQKERKLFTDGVFRYIRHPNYLGQMLVYSSFAMMSFDWIPLSIYIFVWLAIFMPNMLIKEVSMSRYPEWSEYKKKSGFLWPKFW